MFVIGNKRLCSSCFAPINAEPCRYCGYAEGAASSEVTALPCGSVLQGRFAVGKVMGCGGFGITYLAYDTQKDAKIAVKEYFPVELVVRQNDSGGLSARDERAAKLFKSGAEKFYNEASFIAQFSNNPNIVKVYDFFCENNTVYFTMEYLEGLTVKDYAENRGVLSAEQAVSVMERMARALSEVHSHSVLHRDVSPDNIMLCANGSVRLIDFGAARQVFPEGSQLMSVILKPGFAPLEQYMTKGKQGPWTDIYSLGASIYYSLTREIPEDPQSRTADDSMLAMNRYGIRPDLWSILYKCMAIRREERYQNTGELLNDLSALPVQRKLVTIPRRVIKEKETEKKPKILGIIKRILHME